MEKNKKFLWIYIIALMAVGATLLIVGAIYVGRYWIADWPDDSTEKLGLILSMAIGLIEAIFGGILLSSAVKGLQSLIPNKEQTIESSTESDNNTSTSVHKKRAFTLRSLFYSTHFICIATLLIFILVNLYIVFGTEYGVAENLYIIVPFFAVFFVFIFPDAFLQRRKKNKKISENRYKLWQEFYFTLGAMYCVIINLIFLYQFDIATLVAFAVLLAIESGRAIDLIIIISKTKNKTNSMNENVVTNNEPEIDNRFIADDKNKDD